MEETTRGNQTNTPALRGRFTYVDMTQHAPFFLPWEKDPWGRMRPAYSLDMMRLSAELAASAYDLNIDDWVNAGWRDFSFQVDDMVKTDAIRPTSGNVTDELLNRWTLYRARSAMRQSNPVRQIVGVMQRQGSNTGKVLVMIRPDGTGRYVVAIGFMGTGGRIYDWFSNLKFASANGIHQGFLELAQQFADYADKFEFHQTARELGLDRLTLADILEEAKREDSRFKLWTAGHSQGGALVQVWTHLQLSAGVLPENMVGYGFASPTVMLGNACETPEAYPIYHILNSDDVVPRTGAQIHLGLCLTYPACDTFRQAAYGWKTTPEAVKARVLLNELTGYMVDMATTAELAIAYLSVALENSPEDLIILLEMMHIHVPPIKQLLNALHSRTPDVMRIIQRQVERSYMTITGSRINPKRIEELKGRARQVVDAVGISNMTKALGEMMLWPHILMPEESRGTSAYIYIAREGYRDLQPSIWQSGTPPIRLYLHSKEILEAPALAPTAAQPAAPVRGPLPKRRHVVLRRRGYSTRRKGEAGRGE